MKKQLSNFGYLVLVSLFSTSFTVQAQKNNINSQNQVDIYMAGNCSNGTAMYYKNGQPSVMIMNGERGNATSILVVGNDVYVTGDVDGKAVYWKNGQLVQLPSTGIPLACATSIAVVGNDVYVGGYGHEYLNSYRKLLRPRYWKNGQEILLPQPPFNGYEHAGEASVQSIAVVDNDVYVIGRCSYTPVYWKNGQLIEALNNGLQRVVGITSIKGDTYAVGAQNQQAAYWKNGQTKILGTDGSIATAIAVSGNDVYVIGANGNYEAKNLYGGYGNGNMGRYWRNGQPLELSGTTYLYPTSIAVAGSDVYITGFDETNARYRLWKNGQYEEISCGKYFFDPKFVVSSEKSEGGDKMPTKSSTQKQVYIAPLNPKEEADKFLAENKKKPGIITTASGLQYEIIKKGTGAKPTATDKVKVHYHGTLINGDLFDSSINRGYPITFPLNQVLAGWTEGVQLMNVGSKYKFFIPANLAYGDQAAGDKIKPGTALIFEVELLEIVK